MDNSSYLYKLPMSERCSKSRKLSVKKVKRRRCYFKMKKAGETASGGCSSIDGEGGGGGGDAGGGGSIAVIVDSSDSNNVIMAKNQMSSSMQQFCIDSNVMANTARKCSLTGKKQQCKYI